MALQSLLSVSSCKVVVVLYLLFLVQSHIASSANLVGVKKHHKTWSAPKGNLSSCNLYYGSWVHDVTYPMYQYTECPIIDSQFNCQLNGRPDFDFLRYRWKPDSCELPRFDGSDFLGRMRGKTVMFVGDSLGFNQWQSLICMLAAAVPLSPTQSIKKNLLSTFKFLEYGVSILFYRTPYLVDIDVIKGSKILRLEKISYNSNGWKDADVLLFNSGHWWTLTGALKGWDFMEMGGVLYPDMNRLAAFDRAMRTWASWVDANIDTGKTRVFIQGISPTHYNPSEWDAPSSRNCYAERAPISGSIYRGPYPDQMGVITNVTMNMTTPTYLLDITLLSQLRKDAHPSIYGSSKYTDPNRPDCSHWCLPGLPDTWNQLFYATMFF